jgi:hypothetical protein
MCVACGTLFRKPPSRVKRAKKQFCSEECRIDFTKGINHPMWVDGRSASSFSKWVQNQADYQYFKQEALRRAGNKCEITGRTENLDVHHIKPKADYHDMALDPNNALVLSEEVHIEMHKLMKDGLDFDECVKILKEKFSEEVCEKDSYQ